MQEADEAFFDRADAHIHLSNEQLKTVGRGAVSASTLYAAARFNAWVSACRCSSRSELQGSREETVRYLVEQYRVMLEENLDDYLENFEFGSRQ